MNASQLSMDEALAARDAALERVEAAADAEWRDDAESAVLNLCMTDAFWTSEDVWACVTKPREPRALGPILKAAVKRGWCEPMGFVTCSMTSRHAAPVRQYRSLLSRGVGSPSTALPASQTTTASGGSLPQDTVRPVSSPAASELRFRGT